MHGDRLALAAALERGASSYRISKRYLRPDGAVVVLLHGLIMDHTLWRDVVPALAQTHRCILPTLPLGAHRCPMREGADLGIHGQVAIVGDFLDALDLHDVTLVLNDWGAPQLLVHDGRDARIGRLVLTSCEAFGNYPPGLPGRTIGLAVKAPGGLAFALQQLRVPLLRRLPMTFGWMAKRPIPREVMDGWLAPGLADPAVRRDLLAYARPRIDTDETTRWSESLRGFDRPALVLWAAEDRVMPPDHARRLAALLPQGRLEWIEDSYTLIPLDRPAELADRLLAFLRDTAPAPSAPA